METKLKLPKKLLSMFLAVLMAFSCFSLVMPELVPQAKAAVTVATVKELVSKAAGKTATSNTGNTAKFTGDDGSIIPLPLRFLLAFRRLRRCRGHLIPKFVGKECTDNAPFAVV